MTPSPRARALVAAALLTIPVAGLLTIPGSTSTRPVPDEEALRTLHATVLRAHRESSVAMLLADAAEDFVQANRGEIAHPTPDERRARFASYLGRTTFEEYRDLVDPIVKVSKDGTLGWVIAQVRGRGVQRTDTGGTEPLEFTSAWIELYEKRGGRWVAVGNVSNFKP